MSTIDVARSRLPRGRTLGIAAAIFWLETVVVGWYVLYEPVRVTDPLVLVYPLAWINASLLAVWMTEGPTVGRRYRLVGGVVGIGYFLVLAWTGGLIQIHALHGHGHEFGFLIEWPLPPGWGPTLLFSNSAVGFAVIPYKVIGYATLAYLVYVTILETVGSAWTGLVGLFSCVSCTWPVLGTVLTGALGGSSVIVVFATEQPYAASTIVFLSAVAVLLWRPRFRSRF